MWKFIETYTKICAYAGLAQLVEHLIRNEGVVGSSPITGTRNTNGKNRNNYYKINRHCALAVAGAHKRPFFIIVQGVYKHGIPKNRTQGRFPNAGT